MTQQHESSQLLPDNARRKMIASKTIRADIWTVLRYRSSISHHSGLHFASLVLELCILSLVLINVILAISMSSDSFSTSATSTNGYETFLFVSTVIFSIEYILRLWSCVEDPRYHHSALWGRLSWMIRPMSIIDLSALVPFYLEICFEYSFIPSSKQALTLRSLRLLRIISFLRLERSYNAMTNLRLIFGRKKEELLVVSYLTSVVVLTASTLIFFLENPVQPKVFSSIGIAAWWSVETITSLGYGDIVPQTTAGRVFGAILAIWGIILFTIPGAILGSAFIEVMLEQQQQKEEDAYRVALQLGAGSPALHSTTSLNDQDEDDEPMGGFGLSPNTASPFRRLSPRLSPRLMATLHTEILTNKIEELIRTQHLLQNQMTEQRKQIDEMQQLLHKLAS